MRSDLVNITYSSDVYMFSRNQLMLSHEEQLSQMTALCKQEMKLLMTVKTTNQVIN